MNDRNKQEKKRNKSDGKILMMKANVVTALFPQVFGRYRNIHVLVQAEEVKYKKVLAVFTKQI